MAAQSEEHTVVKSEQVSAVFVTLILKHPVLLNKSQLPSIKEKKWNALQDAKAIIAKTTGKNMDDKQILKKVANMKVQVKKKMEAAKTGNQTINLRSWEKDLFYALKGQKTPTCTTTHKMASAISAGFCSSSCASADVSFGVCINFVILDKFCSSFFLYYNFAFIRIVFHESKSRLCITLYRLFECTQHYFNYMTNYSKMKYNE